MNFLIADESPDGRRLLSRLVQEQGDTVVSAVGSGLDAVKRFIELKPDCTILDLRLSDSDGMETLGHIRWIDSRAQVLMTSEDATHAEVRATLDQGARDFIRKPITFERLASALAPLREIRAQGVEWV